MTTPTVPRPVPDAATPRSPVRAVGRGFATVHRGVRAVFRGLARAISLPLLAVTYVVVGLVPWLPTTVRLADPLWAPRRRGSGWVPRDENVEQRPSDLGATDPVPRRLLTERRWRRVLPNVLIAIGLALAVKDFYRNVIRENPPVDPANRAPEGAPNTGDDGPPRAEIDLKAEPWWDELSRASTTFFAEVRATQFTGSEPPDIRSRWLNVRDGVRSSWAPPVQACRPRLRVWAFGGSTMFGVGQRDEHTIASELARAAWADGVALDVENRGVPGDVAWIELQRLRRTFAGEVEPPDLVVFYDGFNDMRAVEWAYLSGRDVTDRLTALNDRDFTAIVNRLVRREVDGKEQVVADAVDVAARPADETVIHDAVVFQYGLARRLTDQELADRAIPSVAFFQPSVGSRDPLVAGDWPTTILAQRRIAAMRRALPPGVVDLADVLDGPGPAYYVDDVHTNEAANVPIGSAMWKSVRPVVGSLPAAAPQPGCG